MNVRLGAVPLTAALYIFTVCSDRGTGVGSDSVQIPDPPASDCQVVGPVDVTAADHVVGDGTSGSCTEQALAAAVAQGGTIRCNCGATTIQVSQEMTLSHNTVLDGGGVVLDGGGQTRFFRKLCVGATQADGLTFTLQNITLQNGMGDSTGGAVRNEVFGTFTATNVSFLNNHCRVQAVSDWGGGAVYSLLQREAVYSSCTFRGNSASNGGAIGGIGTSLLIVNCTFDQNRATGNGATNQGGTGGAIYIDNLYVNGVNAFLRLCGSVFTNNTSNALAGALFVYMHTDQHETASIDRCTFEHNSEPTNQAGAIYLQNRVLTLTNSTFSGNHAGTQGGALWTIDADVALGNCTFDSNAVSTDLGSQDYGMGGAIASLDGTLTIGNCTFAHNSATHFSAAIKRTTGITLVNTLFYDNYLVAAAANVNLWAGVVLDKDVPISDLGGNMEYPVVYTAGSTSVTDEWLGNDAAVLRLDAELRPLADNGGPTPTMALPVGSPAIDAGSGQGCTPTDQRGYARVGVCDIGAYEYGAVP